MSTTSNVVRATFQSWFATYYARRSELLKAISDEQKSDRTTTIDLSSLDSNTYYPVTFALAQGISQYNFKIYVPLSRYTAPWASHNTGTFSLNVEWSSSASGWGAQVVNRFFTTVVYAWTTSSQSPVMNINQMSNSSVEYVYLRGGTKYDITHQKNLTPVLRTTAYTVSGQTISPMAYNASLVPTTFLQSIAKAQSDADTANSVLSDISSDNKLTPLEKQWLKTEWDSITNEKANYEAQASNYGLSISTYRAAYDTLNANIPPLLSNMSSTSNITRGTFQSWFATYYLRRSELLKAIADSAKTYTDKVSVGGTNLALNTDNAITLTGNNTGNQSLTAYYLNDTAGNLSKKYSNDEFTVSFNWSVSGSTITGGFLPQLSNVPWAAGAPSVTVSASNSSGFYVGKMSGVTSSSAATLVQIRLDAFQGVLTITNFKFEVGNRNTSWSPAPEDLIKYVDNTTGNLVNNVTRSGNVDRWSAGTVSNQAFLGYTVPVHTITTTGDVMALSDKFVVDPSKAYEVSIWMKASNNTAGTDYFGLHCYNEAGVVIGCHGISNDTGADNSAVNTNFYFWSGGHAAHLDWVKRTAYIMPAGTGASMMKGIGQNVLLNARMLPTTTHIAVRWLNYYNGGTSTTTWVANAKVVEVDPTVVMNLANANSLVDDIAADGKLTPVEKKQLKLIWDNILKEKTTISATADSYGIATATKDAYNTAYTTLFNQVNPLLSNLNVTSDVVRATLNTNFATYYEKRTLITQAIDTAWVASGGSIDGGKIASDTVTTDQILLSSGNMIYGGLDNFSNYSTLPSGYGERATNTLSQDYPLFGPNSFKHVSTSANSYYYLHPSSDTTNAWLKLDTGQQYILSAYVRTTSSTATSVNLAAVIREGATSSGGTGTGTGNLVLSASDGWKQVYIKFTAGGTNPYLSYYLRNVNTGITTYWTGFMLEKVSASQTKPFQFSQGNITRIDGGNIVTKSIKAESIDVTDLSAISANLGSIKVDTANIKDLAVDTLQMKNGSVTQYASITQNGNVWFGSLQPSRINKCLVLTTFRRPAINGTAGDETRTIDGEFYRAYAKLGTNSESRFSSLTNTTNKLSIALYITTESSIGLRDGVNYLVDPPSGYAIKSSQNNNVLLFLRDSDLLRVVQNQISLQISPSGDAYLSYVWKVFGENSFTFLTTDSNSLKSDIILFKA
ncbi:tail protein [Acinetobacter phage vB_AbaM_ME3]|uniref:Structural protein n=1 Tax=Acinetobacter phage vB_AbaM_ME3 TaxID=1837876 RepID=A0A172Q098_9CAUD|nr:tail protein [Acinetobacter phage vB_AbaM_ME3]AND75264.1 structural protein [Acinetobacter phage vB_AbaM_ME3]